MPKAINYKPEQRIFAMFVGRSGDGKSVAAASFPRPFFEYDFDFRFGGIAAAINQGIIANGEEIEYQQFSPRGGWDCVDKHLLQLESYRVTGQFPYKTIEIASLGSLTRILTIASHSYQSGKKLGNLRVSGPADFNFEATATHQVFDFLRSFPCNIICSAHVVDKYGKLDKSKDYSETGIIGEKLSIRDNLGENVLTYFDNVIRFSRNVEDGTLKFYAEFTTDLAKNVFGIPPGKYDITNKSFYKVFQQLIQEHKKG